MVHELFDSKIGFRGLDLDYAHFLIQLLQEKSIRTRREYRQRRIYVGSLIVSLGSVIVQDLELRFEEFLFCFHCMTSSAWFGSIQTFY